MIRMKGAAEVSTINLGRAIMVVVALILTKLPPQVPEAQAPATLGVAEICAAADREAIVLGMVSPLLHSSNTHPLQGMLGQVAPLPPTNQVAMGQE